MFFVKKNKTIRAPPRSSSKHLCSALLVIIRIRLICGFYNNMMTYGRCRVLIIKRKTQLTVRYEFTAHHDLHLHLYYNIRYAYSAK